MRVLSEETAAKLQRLLNRPAGRVSTTPPATTGPRMLPSIIQFFYIESDTAIDTSVTDPSLTKDYYDAHIVVYNAATEDTTSYGEIYVTTLDDSSLAEGYGSGMCVGQQTINEETKPLFIPFSLTGADTISVVSCAYLEEV